MSQGENIDAENLALQERLSRLTEASLRINESLEFDTVLQGVLDSVRTLTGARYGVITLLAEDGTIQEFLSSGFSSKEAQLLWELPDGPTLFNYLCSIDEPLRVRDFHSHVRSKGLPEFQPPVDVGTGMPLMATPIRNKGEVVGIFFVGEKEDGKEFTAGDEETLVMFAAQAAMAIVNARRYRDEQQARAHLETVIDTSPVGVVVFNARTGVPISFNREVVRIIESLQGASPTPERIMEVLTVRRADGTEISLEELPVSQALGTGETVRAEEVVLKVPDGRSVTVLINSTPIRSEGGEVETVVITLQDMTPLQETERLRAEFLGMVSHELRTPLTSIKGSVATLLDPTEPLNQAEMRQFLRIIDSQTDRMRALIRDLLDLAQIETGALPVSPDPSNVAALVNDARSSFMASGGRHPIQVKIPQDLPWVMADRDRMVQVLGNLISNAARHSPVSSPISISAARGDFHVTVSVSDRGRGIPADTLPQLFRKFSHPDAGDRGGNTGLGLAICRGIVEAHGGRIWAESDGPGLGARFNLTIPTVEEAGFVTPISPPPLSSRQGKGLQVRILAVDDDPQALRLVRESLSSADYLVFSATNSTEALRLVGHEKPELVLLDLMLPGTDGIGLMQEIREGFEVPVIFLSAYGQEDLVARAFDSGAADYVVKPFAPSELSARIRAALRRQAAPEPVKPYVLGDLEIDYAQRRVTLAGRPVRLTDIEYRTLAELASNAGRVVTYAQLLRRIWGMDKDGDVRPMRTVISTLRRQLADDADDPRYIFTQPRVGYRMARDGEDSHAGG